MPAPLAGFTPNQMAFGRLRHRMTYGLTIEEDGRHGTEQATKERAGGTR
ncbi:hypothetical protein HO950_11115 [Streptococcus suis]|nr:hypothetical protein [Streptococcus suis]HEM5504694.1 hypothetical protein [Streptococcus suis]